MKRSDCIESRKPDWLARIFPHTQHSITVNGRRMSYVDEGDPHATPVLLLSGNPTWGFLYRDFIPPLTGAGYRAIAPDWIGCGYSDHPRVDAALTFEHHIADLVSFIDQLDLREFVIVGHMPKDRSFSAGRSRAGSSRRDRGLFKWTSLSLPRRSSRDFAQIRCFGSRNSTFAPNLRKP